MPLDFSKQEPDWETLLASIRRTEGGDNAKVHYGILSTPTKGEADAKRIAMNTVKNNYKRWNTAGQPGDYLNFLADRYVPIASDPQGNVNWKSNVSKIYAQLSAKKPEVKKAKPAPALDPLLLRPLPPVNYPMFPQYPLVTR